LTCRWSRCPPPAIAHRPAGCRRDEDGSDDESESDGDRHQSIPEAAVVLEEQRRQDHGQDRLDGEARYDLLTSASWNAS